MGGQNLNRLWETELATNSQLASEKERTVVVAPATAGEASEVMRVAGREGLTVIPAGSSTWLDAGNPLNRADLILTTRRLTKIIRHEPADLVATAEAGVTLSEFQKHLAAAGQFPDSHRADA